MLNYANMVTLDAEDLAEQGLRDAYVSLDAELRKFGVTPEEIEEIVNPDEPSFMVRHRGIDYPIYGPTLAESSGEGWGRATHALFAIVNAQLGGSAVLFYAINGGNDLGGMFLTPGEVDSARRELPKKSDWPYLPNSEAPAFGMFW